MPVDRPLFGASASYRSHGGAEMAFGVRRLLRQLAQTPEAVTTPAMLPSQV